MPIRVVTAAPAAPKSQITDLSAAAIFQFTHPTEKGNNGLCVRVKDSKVGKGRFLNLETGKLLTTTPGDRATVVPAGTNLTVS